MHVRGVGGQHSGDMAALDATSATSDFDSSGRESKKWQTRQEMLGVAGPGGAMLAPPLPPPPA